MVQFPGANLQLDPFQSEKYEQIKVKLKIKRPCSRSNFLLAGAFHVTSIKQLSLLEETVETLHARTRAAYPKPRHDDE